MNAEDYRKRAHNYLFEEINFDVAIKDLTEAIKLEPSEPDTYYMRGLAYSYKKEFDLSIKDYNEAIKLKQSDGDFYCNRAYAYIFKGDKNQAISDLEMAVKINPQNEGYREMLEGFKKSDIKEVQSALCLQNADYFFQNGNDNQAVSELEMALIFQPENNKVRETLNKIKIVLEHNKDRVSVSERFYLGNKNINGHIVVIGNDGTVIAKGGNKYGQCNVSDWRDIIAVATCKTHTAGLKADGTVVAIGKNNFGQCDVSSWHDIIAISVGSYPQGNSEAETGHTIGLKKDGTVVAVGRNQYGQCNVSDWNDIIAIATESSTTIGLKKDGTVVAVGRNGWGQCNVSDWSDIVAISLTPWRTVGLKADGTVVTVGADAKGNHVSEHNALGWSDAVAISGYVVGLKADGRVVVEGDEKESQNIINSWDNIVAIDTSFNDIVGLKKDGTIFTTGKDFEKEYSAQIKRQQAPNEKKFLITILVTGVIGGLLGLTGGIVGLFFGLFFGIGLRMFWSYTKHEINYHLKAGSNTFAEERNKSGMIEGFFTSLFIHILLFLFWSIWNFIKSPFVTIYRLIIRDFSFDTI